jgi:GDA1/CD39 (nucleoside phosphatase) family
MRVKIKGIMTFFVFTLLGINSLVGHTAVFSIVPKAGTSLPTQVTIGGSVKALYTVTNTTGSLHAGNYVKYVPKNTVQVTVDATYPDLCGATFQLASKASCTLELNVTGAVNASAPNPRDHLFVCLGGCVTCCAGTNFPLNVIEENPIYTAVFDAGSSGTRLSFYKVIPGSGGYPIIEKIGTYDDSLPGVPDDDGINNFLNGDGSIELAPGQPLPPGCPGTSGLGQLDVEPCVIQPLLNKLDQGVVAQNASNPGLNLRPSQVQVELFATAGMRTEDERNGGGNTTEQILEYYQQMKTYVAQWGYGVGEFKTINGNSEEGVWTWVNLNDYYYNSFGGNTTVSPTVQYPVGNFEVGGSSMQIAFPTNTTPSDAANVYEVLINGYTYNVYSKTFLGLGGDDARKYVKAYNYNSNDGGVVCYAASATVNNTREKSGIQLYPSDQVSGFYPFPTNAGYLGTPWTSIGVDSLLLVGSSNYDVTACSGLYDITVNQVTSLVRNNYGTFNEGGVVTMASFKSDLETSNSPFLGIDNFFYTSKDLDYYPSTGFDSSVFQQKLQDYCTGSVPSNFNAQNVCPNGNFMNTYLFGTSGLFTGSTATFAGVLNPLNVANETVLTWTRGYLLLKYAN